MCVCVCVYVYVSVCVPVYCARVYIYNGINGFASLQVCSIRHCMN